MKKLLLLLLLPVIGLAQKKEAVYKKLATQTCECSKKTTPLTEMALGVCIFAAIEKLETKEMKAINYNPDKKMESVKGIAENIGLEMALICPETIMAMNSTDGQGDDEIIADVQEDEDLSVVGTFESITSNEFKTIHVMDDQKAVKDFIWLFSFEGDNLFIKNKIVKGDKLEVHYRELEFFDAKSNTYKVFNEITEIKLL